MISLALSNPIIASLLLFGVLATLWVLYNSIKIIFLKSKKGLSLGKISISNEEPQKIKDFVNIKEIKGMLSFLFEKHSKKIEKITSIKKREILDSQMRITEIALKKLYAIGAKQYLDLLFEKSNNNHVAKMPEYIRFENLIKTIYFSLKSHMYEICKKNHFLELNDWEGFREDNITLLFTKVCCELDDNYCSEKFISRSDINKELGQSFKNDFTRLLRNCFEDIKIISEEKEKEIGEIESEWSEFYKNSIIDLQE